ncbi:UNVERIFIED_CONTAM: Peptidyl-prolyl cis-trans isomerase CYP23 [Sesamum indicum]
MMCSSERVSIAIAIACMSFLSGAISGAIATVPELGSSRVVFQYAIFGKVTKGDETLRKLEQVPTRTEGIFVMPTERITILSTYYYDTEVETCEEDRLILKRRLAASAVEIEKQQEPKAKMNALLCSR